MRYVLGIHLGGTRATAALARHDGTTWGEPEVLPLDGGTWVESVLHVSADGNVLVGRAARQQAATEPHRIARGFLRRVGDDVPLVLGDHSYPAEAFAAVLAGWVADRAAEAEDGDATLIAATHPPGWGPYRRGLLGDALHDAGLPGVLLLPTPVAAAESHLAGHQLEVGATIVVCRLGRDHTEATLLRRTATGFEPLAHDERSEPGLGGRLDDLLAEYVLTRIDTAEPAPGFRVDCAEAKERLSVAPEASASGVRVTRAAFEELAREPLAAAVSLCRATATRGDRPAAAVLAGGIARVPLVAELARSAFDCPVAVEPDPGTAVCRGAALAAVAAASRTGGMVEPATPADSGWLAPVQPDVIEVGDPPRRPPVEITPLEAPASRFRRRSRKDSKDGDET